MKSNDTNLLRKAEKVVPSPTREENALSSPPMVKYSSRSARLPSTSKEYKAKRFENNMGKIRRARQKLHLPAVKPNNEKDKQDVMKPNEVCQTCPL